MKQVKSFLTEKGINKWIKNNQDKEILDIVYSQGTWGIVYEERFL